MNRPVSLCNVKPLWLKAYIFNHCLNWNGMWRSEAPSQRWLMLYVSLCVFSFFFKLVVFILARYCESFSLAHLPRSDTFLWWDWKGGWAVPIIFSLCEKNTICREKREAVEALLQHMLFLLLSLFREICLLLEMGFYQRIWWHSSCHSIDAIR